MSMGTSRAEIQSASAARSNYGLDLVIVPLRKIYFREIDQNRDGFLSQTEILRVYLHEYISQIDKNKDGLITETEFVSAKITINPELSISYGLYLPTRESLRYLANKIWTMINRDENQYLTLDEYMAYANQPALPVHEPEPSVPGSGGQPGYGDTYGGNGNPPYAANPDTVDKLRKQMAQQAFQMGDKNLDKLLTFSEFEDLCARLILSNPIASQV